MGVEVSFSKERSCEAPLFFLMLSVAKKCDGSGIMGCLKFAEFV